MQQINSRNARINFGKLLDDAQQEPIEVVRRGGEPSAVIMSREEYDTLIIFKRQIEQAIAKVAKK